MKQHHFYIFDSINKKQLYPFFLVSFALATTPNSTFAADTQNTQWSIAPYDKAVAAFNEQKQLEIEKQDPINNYGVDDYVVIADTVDFSDNSMALGNIFGSKLELGAHSKIYGNASPCHGDLAVYNPMQRTARRYSNITEKDQNNDTVSSSPLFRI